MRTLLILFLLMASPALAQVEVTTGDLKPTYLQGEPIVVTVEVTNVGADPIAYSGCDARVSFDVLDTARRVPPNLLGCSSGEIGGGGGCGQGDPPQLTTGERTSFTYLLTGYDLPPGHYRARITGRAGVSWAQGPNFAVRGARPVPLLHQPSEPVPGAFFERLFTFEVVHAAQDDLTRAFAPYVANAASHDLARRIVALEAITETAPLFLAGHIAQLIDDPGFGYQAIEALGRMNTPESRARLRALYDDEKSPQRREAIVLALARDGNPDDLDFLAGIAHDRTAQVDTRRRAILGLGHIGGDRSAHEIADALPGLEREGLWYAVIALGNTRSREAVSILIDAPVDIYRDNVCNALITLTHRQWCGGDAATIRQHWRDWWQANGATAPLFGNDACPAQSSAIPPID
jgi:hypothetical protein